MQKKFVLFAAILLSATFLQYSDAGASRTSKLRQQILPIDCVFEIVDSGTNQIVYITPKECGQQITPTDPVEPTKPTKPTTPTKPNTGPAYFPPSSKPEPRAPTDILVTPQKDSVIKLNLFPEYFNSGSDAGKKIALAPGQTVYFDVQDSTYSLRVKDITGDSISIAIFPVQNILDPNDNVLAADIRIVTVRVPSTARYDIDNDLSNDIEITILGIENNVANVKFRQLASPALAPCTSTEALSTTTVTALLVIVILTSYLALLFYMNSKRIPPPDDTDE